MSDYTRVVNAADAWGSVPLTACGWCGVFVADPHLHTRWCPGQEHDRKMADYEKVFKTQEVEVTVHAPSGPPREDDVIVHVQGLEIPLRRVNFDHKEP
jgi:hypothetical protein